MGVVGGMLRSGAGQGGQGALRGGPLPAPQACRRPCLGRDASCVPRAARPMPCDAVGVLLDTCSAPAALCINPLVRPIAALAAPQGEFVDLIHRSGMVQSAEFTATGTRIKAHVPQSLARKLAPMAVGGQGAAPPLQIGLQHRDWEGP